MPRSKTLVQKNISHFAVPGFKAETFSLLLTKYAKRYSMKLNSRSHVIYLRVGFSLTKAFEDFLAHELDLKNSFCENVGDEVVLQPFIMSKRACFVLKGVAFLFVKNVLDFWYSGYFLLIAMGKLWKQQEDKAS